MPEPMPEPAPAPEVTLAPPPVKLSPPPPKIAPFIVSTIAPTAAPVTAAPTAVPVTATPTFAPFSLRAGPPPPPPPPTAALVCLSKAVFGPRLPGSVGTLTKLWVFGKCQHLWMNLSLRPCRCVALR